VSGLATAILILGPVLLLATGAARGFTLSYTLRVIWDGWCHPLKYLKRGASDEELRPPRRKR
jgi:hypothetical protein